MDEKVNKTEREWREQLSEEQYNVTRESGTEEPFTGEYWNSEDSGTYMCVCCGLPLFRSSTKFDAGCGWPSFFEPLEGANLVESEDRSHGMVRVEIRCNRCDSHLGHVFKDGPPPTGLRYCINSAAMDFENESPEEGGKDR